jgi:hypothetical protein
MDITTCADSVPRVAKDGDGPVPSSHGRSIKRVAKGDETLDIALAGRAIHREELIIPSL